MTQSPFVNTLESPPPVTYKEVLGWIFFLPAGFAAFILTQSLIKFLYALGDPETPRLYPAAIGDFLTAPITCGVGCRLLPKHRRRAGAFIALGTILLLIGFTIAFTVIKGRSADYIRIAAALAGAVLTAVSTIKGTRIW